MAEHLTITGHVQGVGFRAFVKDVADGMGVSGWVRNRPDGAVEVVAEGDVDAFEARLREGPSFGRVDDIARMASDAHITQGFSIRR